MSSDDVTDIYTKTLQNSFTSYRLTLFKRLPSATCQSEGHSQAGDFLQVLVKET